MSHDRIRVVDYAAGFQAGYLKYPFVLSETDDWRRGWFYGVSKRVEILAELAVTLRDIMTRKEKEA